jgi:tRNA-splicing ligase RtcB
MNSRQLQKLGVPEDCVKSAIVAIQSAMKAGDKRGKQIKQAIKDVLERPQDFTADEHFGQFAQAVIADREFVRPEPISYRTWGSEIDEASHAQMRQACSVPMAAGAALMPDAHVGYGLPIGGVLALEGAVIPYAVGVDIACRMKLSVLDMPPSALDDNFNLFKEAL